jgi:hypothetical protein
LDQTQNLEASPPYHENNTPSIMSTTTIPNTTMTATTVCSIGELVENILAHLDDIKTLATAQRVCRLWRVTVKNSKPPRSALFLELSRRVEIWWFKDGLDSTTCAQFEVPIVDITAESPHFLAYNDNDVTGPTDPNPKRWPGKVRILEFNPFCSHPASWKKPSFAKRIRLEPDQRVLKLSNIQLDQKEDLRLEMFVTQPPCATVKARLEYEACDPPLPKPRAEDGCVHVKNPGGVRIRDILEGLAQKASEAGLELDMAAVFKAHFQVYLWIYDTPLRSHQRSGGECISGLRRRGSGRRKPRRQSKGSSMRRASRVDALPHRTEPYVRRWRPQKVNEDRDPDLAVGRFKEG